MKKKISQKCFIFSYYKARPGQAIEHKEVVDWATEEWEKLSGKKFRDPDKAIRILFNEGTLIKIRNGVYKYDPDVEVNTRTFEFTQKQKDIILRRGNYKCAICGATEKDGVELQIDHIKPRKLGGESTIENGQVLCASHNYRKKNLRQTEVGKKMFINLLQLARKKGDSAIVDFCNDVLNVYDKHKIDGHIDWQPVEE